MAWDNTKPPASGLLISAEVRSNWDALQASLMGVNWVADPNFYIWSAETSNGAAGQTTAPDHWQIGGTGATLQRCGSGLSDTTDLLGDGWAAELTYGSATATLGQSILDSIPSWLQGEQISVGVMVKGSGASVARLYAHDSGTGYTYSAYNSGTSAEWLTVTHTIGAGTALSVGVELASGSAHIQGMTVLLGAVPPLYALPAPVVFGAVAAQESGTPGSAAYYPVRATLARPMLFTGISVAFATNPSGGTYVCNARMYSAVAAGFVDMLASDLSITDGHYGGSSESVDSVYSYRCVPASNPGASTATATPRLSGYTVTNAGSAAYPTMMIRGLQFSRPQDALVLFNDPTKMGA